MNPVARAIGSIGAASWFVARAARGLAATLIDGDALGQRRLVRALDVYLWGPLPVLIMLAALVGMVAGTVAARLLALYHVELLVVPALVDSLCRDVVPILIGLFASGRVSVDLAARLAGAGLAREIDALEALGHDPTVYYLSPALLGVIAAVPVHMLVAATVALAATGFTVELAGGIRWPAYLHLVTGQHIGGALIVGTAKAALFGALALGVGAVIGSQGARTPAEIGARATTAFTAGLLVIFAAAATWTVLL